MHTSANMGQKQATVLKPAEQHLAVHPYRDSASERHPTAHPYTNSVPKRQEDAAPFSLTCAESRDAFSDVPCP
eukprot:scaffold237057_cov22-Tisochrysis_lutea.AAC.1